MLEKLGLAIAITGLLYLWMRPSSLSTSTRNLSHLTAQAQFRQALKQSV